MSEITSIKILQDGDKVEISVLDKKEEQSIDYTYHRKPHKDFMDAFQKLSAHALYILLPAQLSIPKDPEEKKALLKNVKVTSYSITGEDEKQAIIISYGITGPHGYNGINSSRILFNAKPDVLYAHMAKLNDDLVRIEAEANKYMEGKSAPENQTSMFDEKGEPITNAQIAEPVKIGKKGVIVEADKDAMERVKEDKPKGKGGRKKKVQQTHETPSGEVEIEEPLGPGLDQPN